MKLFKKLSDPKVAEALLSGQIGIIPTDTVYGIVCLANNEASVNRLYGLKSRIKKPGTIIAADIDQLVGLGIKRRYLKAVEQFWPGSISVEIPHSVTYLNQGTGRQALRIPVNESIHSLLLRTGPLQTTSANLPDEPTSTTIKEAQKYFGKKIDFYVDGGDLSNQPASTIIRIVDDAIEIIRQGSEIPK